MSVDLSIIIVSWNVRDALRDCLQSLENTKQDISMEIILIDNASEDGTREMLNKEFPHIDTELSSVNEGLSKPWNRAARRAKGEYLLFLNDDTVVFDHSLDMCVTYMRKNPMTAVLGCKLLNPDLSLQPSVRRLPTLFDQTMIALKIPHFVPQVINKYLCASFDYEKTQHVEQVMGAFFMMPKSIFDKLDGFDESFFIWFEEVDFCKRVRNKDYNVTYFADASIIHQRGASFKQIPTGKLQKIFFRSLFHYFKKHHWFIKRIS
ncbi:MAG: glycosyltransferase family 2 protein [Patescibacteria group bacterium]